MRKDDLLYDHIISELTRLSDSARADAFANTLAALEQDKFANHTEQLKLLRDELTAAKAAQSLSLRFPAVRAALTSFATAFPTFPDLHLHRLDTAVFFADALVNIPTTLNNDQIDATLFGLYRIDPPIPQSLFAFWNTPTPTSSVLFFSLRDAGILWANPAIPTLHEDLLFHALHLIGNAPGIGADQYVIARAGLSDAVVASFLKLHLVASGQAAHTPPTDNRLPSVIDRFVFDPASDYRQLNDVINVLSEYNSRKELLSRFLTIYHIIENFMYKSPIVELESAAGGGMFSIRDFKRLYRRVDQDELSTLKCLMEKVFELHVAAGGAASIADRVVALWDPLIGASADVEQLLARLGIEKRNGPVQFPDFVANHRQNTSDYFARIVYAIRNSIVHNKETEWHLSDVTIGAFTFRFLTEFVLPGLEQITFKLVGARNGIMWYSRPAIKLY